MDKRISEGKRRSRSSDAPPSQPRGRRSASSLSPLVVCLEIFASNRSRSTICKPELLHRSGVKQTRNQEHNINELRIPNCTDVVGVEPAVKNRMEWTRRACRFRSARENNPKQRMRDRKGEGKNNSHEWKTALKGVCPPRWASPLSARGSGAARRLLAFPVPVVLMGLLGGRGWGGGGRGQGRVVRDRDKGGMRVGVA